MANPYRKRDLEDKADVGDYIAAAAATQQWDFYGTVLFSLAIGIEACTASMAGHHARGGVGYLLATMASILAFGMYFFRTYTGRPDAFKTAFVVMHFVVFLGIIVIFVWGMIDAFIAA